MIHNIVLLVHSGKNLAHFSYILILDIVSWLYLYWFSPLDTRLLAMNDMNGILAKIFLPSYVNFRS